MAALLIKAGADVNAANDYGIVPLSLACGNGDAAAARLLLEAGANPNVCPADGRNPGDDGSAHGRRGRPANAHRARRRRERPRAPATADAAHVGDCGGTYGSGTAAARSRCRPACPLDTRRHGAAVRRARWQRRVRTHAARRRRRHRRGRGRRVYAAARGDGQRTDRRRDAAPRARRQSESRRAGIHGTPLGVGSMGDRADRSPRYRCSTRRGVARLGRHHRRKARVSSGLCSLTAPTRTRASSSRRRGSASRWADSTSSARRRISSPPQPAMLPSCACWPRPGQIRPSPPRRARRR